MNRTWYANKTNYKQSFSTNRSADSIHQILAFGTLEEVRSLKKRLGEGKLKELFLNYPKKIYTMPMLNFIKSFILKIDSVDEQKYLKNTPRRTR